MTYTFTKDTPWGKKGDVVRIGESRYVQEESGKTYRQVNEDILFFLLELGVVDDSEWKPKDGDEVYFIRSSGIIEHSTWHKCNPDWFDRVNKSLLGAFPTREEAEKRRDQIKQFVTTLK